MRLIKSIFILMLLISILVFGTWFTLRNQQEIGLDLLFIQLPANSLALWLVLSLLVGLVLGWILLLPKIARMQTQLFSSKRKLKLLEEELHKLRTLSFKDSDNFN